MLSYFLLVSPLERGEGQSQFRLLKGRVFWLSSYHAFVVYCSIPGHQFCRSLWENWGFCTTFFKVGEERTVSTTHSLLTKAVCWRSPTSESVTVLLTSPLCVLLLQGTSLTTRLVSFLFDSQFFQDLHQTKFFPCIFYFCVLTQSPRVFVSMVKLYLPVGSVFSLEDHTSSEN